MNRQLLPTLRLSLEMTDVLARIEQSGIKINPDTLEEIKQAIGEVASYVNPVSTANASQADIASGAAVMSLTDDGKLEYRPLDPFAQWDNASGQKVSKEFIRPSLNTDGYYTVKDTEGNVLDNITIDSYENFVSKGGYDGNASVGAYATYIT